jgi:hypothetical protein
MGALAQPGVRDLFEGSGTIAYVRARSDGPLSRLATGAAS